MEYPTFFTAEAYRTVEPRTANQFALAFVTIHEFGHGYFYGILASNEFEEPILDEGMNEYWDGRMTRESGEKIGIASSSARRRGLSLANTSSAINACPFCYLGARSFVA